MPGIASPLWKRLSRLPSAGQRQFTPLTAREAPAAAGVGAGGGIVAGAGVGTPATGTTVVVAVTAGAAGFLIGTATCVAAVALAVAAVAATAGAAGGAAGGAVTGSNPGAVAAVDAVTGGWDGAETTVGDDVRRGLGGGLVCGARVACAATVLPDGGDSVSRCPGRIVYGAAMPFHCARSRKSTPLRKAIEYNVSLFTTT